MLASNQIRWVAVAALIVILFPEEMAAVASQHVNNQPPASQSEEYLTHKREGDAFLAENKAKEDVVTLESGLQYKVLRAGVGKTPTIEDTVICHFRATHVNGTEFVDSYKRSRPPTLAVKKVIKGWAEALQLMPVGSKWQLFIPSNLAYGERGVKHHVPPNAAVIFEVELIAISPASDGKARASASVGSGALAAIDVSFKIDPRLTQSLYMGDRWVSPPKFNSAQAGSSVKVEARAHGRDATGRTVSIKPRWTAADPEMVTVTSGEGATVTIAVRRAGRSTVQLNSHDISRQLTIKAIHHGSSLQVEIAQ